MHDLEPFLEELSLDGPVEPFLVLADWLQARGDPWGELIAVQCHDDAHSHALMLTGHGLLAQVADRLCPRDQLVGIAWKRGFVSTVAFADSRGTAWLGDELERLFALPVTALVEEVTFTNTHLEDKDVPALLRVQTRLARVPRLCLEYNWFAHKTVPELARLFPNARVRRQHTDDVERSRDSLLIRSWRGNDEDT
jgi:hypothetical protein